MRKSSFFIEKNSFFTHGVQGKAEESLFCECVSMLKPPMKITVLLPRRRRQILGRAAGGLRAQEGAGGKDLSANRLWCD